MGKTIREVAEDLGITKTAIRNRIKEIPNFKEKYVQINGNRFIINDTGVNILENKTQSKVESSLRKSQTKNDNFANINANIENQNANNANLNNDANKQEDLIAVLTKQLNIKDQQLADRAREIAQLHNLLDNSQKLQLIKEQEIKELKGKLQLLEMNKTESNTQTSQTSQTENANFANPNENNANHKKWWQFWK